MTAPHRPIRLLAIIGAAGLALTACGPQVPGLDELTEVGFTRGLTVENPVDQYLQDDPEQVAAFVALIEEHGVDTSRYETPTEEECPQGVTFRVEGVFGDTGYGLGMGIRDCGDSDDSFEAEAVDMLTGWLIDLTRLAANLSRGTERAGVAS